MTPEEYLSQRVDDQIAWYNQKSAQNQRMYKRLRAYEILAAALIPFLTGYVHMLEGKVKFLVGALGVSVAFVSSVQALYKHQENWVQYRSTGEALKSEKHLYLTQAPPYDTPDAFTLFVQRAEGLLTKETSGWTQHITAQSKQPEKA